MCHHALVASVLRHRSDTPPAEMAAKEPDVTDPTPAPKPEPTPEPTPTETTPDANSVRFTPAQEEELNRRMKATRKAVEEEVKKRFETEAEERKRQAEEETERQKQMAAGEFEKVKTSLEGERDTFRTRAESAEARAERAVELLKGRVEEQVKKLTERDTDLAKAFPADADVLDQIAWLEDPRTKRVLDAEDVVTNGFRQPKTPTPVGDKKIEITPLVRGI